jgi:isocitrate dehydrogenase kinase/phosphatase
MITDIDSRLANQTATTIKDAFADYHAEFKSITRKAKEHFERRAWQQLHSDSETRLEVYRDFVARAIGDLKQSLGEQAGDRTLWEAVKKEYTQVISGRPDAELAESFYNSVAMRIVTSKSIDPALHYTGAEAEVAPPAKDEEIYKVYTRKDDTSTLVREILQDYLFQCDYQDLERDTALVADAIDASLSDGPGDKIEQVEVASPVFYRGKGAYLVGRICTGSHYTPLVVALLNEESGVCVDAVLLTEDEVSIIFSFARSYFHVEVEHPRAMVRFLKSIMPRKPVAELYISIGYNKHGKTELYRDLMRHLERSNDKFEIARGERGMVMVVFTLPTYDVVFKIIKDSFDYPKTTTRQEVRNHYYMVFKHDRGGRLVDAQEFEHLRFDKDRFSPALLDELLQVAANTVSVEVDEVYIKHLYTERRLIPLNIYLQEVDGDKAEEAVIEYGQAIKDMAITNIFPGDILLKNFGVTRHGRIVFYDYDELCLLTDCNFRQMPEPQDADEDLASEPWFSVAENDVFPEELHSFLGLPPDLKRAFFSQHGELFGVDFWADLKARYEAGEIIDIFPYKEQRRLSQAAPDNQPYP